ELTRRVPTDAEVLENGAECTHPWFALRRGPSQLRLEPSRRKKLGTEGADHGVLHDPGRYSRCVEQSPHRARHRHEPSPVCGGHVSEPVDLHPWQPHVSVIRHRELKTIGGGLRHEVPQPEAELV